MIEQPRKFRIVHLEGKYRIQKRYMDTTDEVVKQHWKFCLNSDIWGYGRGVRFPLGELEEDSFEEIQKHLPVLIEKEMDSYKSRTSALWEPVG